MIDVGTNSIKLLVAEIEGSGLRPIHEESKQTRLGKGFYETRNCFPMQSRRRLRRWAISLKWLVSMERYGAGDCDKCRARCR